MKDLRVSLVQGNTRWHDAQGNRKYYADLIAPLAGQTDLVVLPETFTSGFTNETLSNAEGMDGVSVAWMADQARALKCVVTGSLVIKEGEKVFNRMLWMRADGSFEFYDKRHLFRMAEEHLRYADGKKKLIVDLHGWKICPMVCYDLRFPVWIRNRYNQTRNDNFDYDVFVVVANWPAVRATPWKTLLRARAIENLCYSVGVNRVGEDGNKIAYQGDSAVIGFAGEALVDGGAVEGVFTQLLDAQALLAHRQRFPAWMDSDSFELT